MKVFKYLILILICFFLNLNSTVMAQNQEEIYAKANGYFVKGELKKAKEIFEKGIQQNPDYSPFYDGLGDVFIKSGDFDKSILMYKKAIDINPEESLYHVHLKQAILQKELLKIKDSSENFYKAIKITPENLTLINNINNFQDGNYKKLNYITDFYQDKKDINLQKANKARFEGSFDKALRYYIEALNNNFQKHKPYNNIGLLYLDKNNTENAIYYFEKALNYNNKSAYIYNNLGVAHIKNKNFLKGEEYFKKASKVYSAYSTAYNNKAIMKIESFIENINEITPSLESLQEEVPENIALIRLLGKLYSLNGEYSKATSLYKTVEKNLDYNFDFMQEYAFFLYKNSEFKKAQHVLKESLKLYKNDSKPYVTLARIYAKIGENEQALDFFEKAIAMNPQEAETYFYYGRFLVNIQKEKEAKGFFDKFSELNENNPTAFIIKNLGVKENL